MKVVEVFDSHYNVDYLKDIYLKKVSLSAATGIDNMSHQLLWPILDEQLEIINRKVLSSNYIFSKYKLKLISKGRGKPPREISIPTIRDKIALKALCNFLQLKYQNLISFKLPQNMIRELKAEISSNKFNSFIKFDVANFYPSIDHVKLISRLRKNIRDERILKLIESAIKSPTVSKASKKDKPSTIGVPQGLSISNILATIYLSNIDKYFSNKAGIKYFRYVDDVFVLCDKKDVQEISRDIIKRFRMIKLKVYDPQKEPEKSSVGLLGKDSFGYLGYYFNNNTVSARAGSIERLRESLLAIFTGYKHSKLKSEEFLEWRLNLRITGCIFQNKSKGWMYFFSEMDDKTLLHQLDDFLKNLCERFNVNVNLKSFLRTYFQIKHNRRETKYVPNFDEYTEDQKTFVLNHYFQKKTENMTSLEIDYHFKKRISKQVKEIETDVKDAGY
ncbi:reverse transcriptase/maturase family protein [Brenneria tiliae]|uniref:reverse transcriptase/maturase family protein n=1 Tax=Brenneria tiliae TaxID=2914984 RepID=UPI002014D18C|nr:reverse transcriptase/maturase family protein [Brenneria tiliae]MCL2899512.1 reverse transcriptase/maturase family protein [Brenneria tiliae]MCL2903890.1 reverse transcriptase/maturase family protein [Brenneria tiliae]